jgi:hypothetical protein
LSAFSFLATIEPVVVYYDFKNGKFNVLKGAHGVYGGWKNAAVCEHLGSEKAYDRKKAEQLAPNSREISPTT